jgi:hypothetical protein
MPDYCSQETQTLPRQRLGKQTETLLKAVFYMVRAKAIHCTWTSAGRSMLLAVSE